MVPPAGTQVWAHPDGDVATARAACAYGTVLSLRDGAGKTVTDVRTATTGPLWWYGIKHYPDEVTEYLLGRAMEAGVRTMFQILLSEFDTAMAMCGCASVADIDERRIVLPGR